MGKKLQGRSWGVINNTDFIKYYKKKQTSTSGKNKSPAFLWYDTDSTENDASNNHSLPRNVFSR
jgi:hypothetical protein